MADSTDSSPEPPRREFRFKPAEFERDNPPVEGPNALPAFDVRELYEKANQPPGSPRNPSRAPAAPAENEVHEILRANLNQANEAGLNEVVLRPKRISRRKRDYWLMLIGGNLALVGLVLVLQKNVVTLVFGGSGIIFYSIGLTWIMWFVMDDY